MCPRAIPNAFVKAHGKVASMVGTSKRYCPMRSVLSPLNSTGALLRYASKKIIRSVLSIASFDVVLSLLYQFLHCFALECYSTNMAVVVKAAIHRAPGHVPDNTDSRLQDLHITVAVAGARSITWGLAFELAQALTAVMSVRSRTTEQHPFSSTGMPVAMSKLVWRTRSAAASKASRRFSLQIHVLIQVSQAGRSGNISLELAFHSSCLPRSSTTVDEV
ncbi:uncharacterized protein B0I36DRAFT_331625 [Microdochium trichocladiopsis]|uniref:Uncharacterized protein n=1 Tax=Microdochium trichocladiopsis TaxID=1682393 RepID=A0A9P8XXU3_9PEZI|nr:uncharacterized protein B0I36DRAFT_331625 [Microdochium trichocladiopsis]KAH7024560.1 hypothetical protein B0I36DRAFT_331625 [Microdochium trichocladiopsis]